MVRHQIDIRIDLDEAICKLKELVSDYPFSDVCICTIVEMLIKACAASVTDQALAGVIQRYMNNDGAGTAKDIVDGSNCGIEPGRHSAYKD